MWTYGVTLSKNLLVTFLAYCYKNNRLFFDSIILQEQLRHWLSQVPTHEVIHGHRSALYTYFICSWLQDEGSLKIHLRLKCNPFLDIFNVLVLLRLFLSNLQTQSAMTNHLPSCQRPPVGEPSFVFMSELRRSWDRPLYSVSFLLLFVFFGESFDVAPHFLQHRVVSVLNPFKMRARQKSKSHQGDILALLNHTCVVWY